MHRATTRIFTTTRILGSWILAATRIFTTTRTLTSGIVGTTRIFTIRIVATTPKPIFARTRPFTTAWILTLVLAACGTTPAEPADARAGDAERPAYTPMPRAVPRHDLRWKRALAIQRDLERGLALEAGTLCAELGDYDCLRSQSALEAEGWRVPDTQGFDGFFDLVTPGGLHLVPLGGNDPFFANQHTPLPRPIVTSVTALDRVALHACGRRVALDAALPASERAVLRHLDLASEAPIAPTDPAIALDITELYRRLLARDPEPAELDAMRELAVDPPETPRELAHLACFVIVTSTEFVFQ